MSRWGERKAVAKDTVADVVFKATDRFIRCQSINSRGDQCSLDKKHDGDCNYPK